MFNRVTHLLFPALLMLGLAACSGSENEPETTIPEEASTDLPTETEVSDQNENGPVQKEAQPSQKAVSAKFSLPEGFELLQWENGVDLAYGDFDQDGATEATALIIRQADPNDIQFGDEVQLVVFELDGEGNWEIRSHSGDLSGESAFYQSMEHLVVEDRVLIYHHQLMRSELDLKFRFEPKYNDYMLIGLDYTSYGNAVHDGSGSTSINFLTGDKISQYNEWDPSKEELKSLPTKKEKFTQPLRPLGSVNAENIWDGV